MSDEIVIKTEYRTIAEIAKRFGRGTRAVTRLIKRLTARNERLETAG